MFLLPKNHPKMAKNQPLSEVEWGFNCQRWWLACVGSDKCFNT